MSTHHSLRSCSSLKKVLTKLENSYQTYVNMYKTHTMATHHRGIGQPLEKDPNLQDQDIDISNDCQHEETDDFENVENETHTRLRDLTYEVDHLQHKIEVAKGQPTDAINCLECELHRLSLALCPSALDEILQQYTETLCTAQKKSTFTNTLLQDITIFNGSDSSQLEDWLIDVETTTYLTSESRTKLAQANSKGLTHTLISEAQDLDKSLEEIKSPPFKNLQFGHSHISKPLHGNSTKRKGIFSSLHSQI